MHISRCLSIHSDLVYVPFEYDVRTWKGQSTMLNVLHGFPFEISKDYRPPIHMDPEDLKRQHHMAQICYW